MHNYKKIFVFFALLFIADLSLAADKSPVKIYHWTLKNNADVFFVRRTEIPMLDIKVLFSAGSVYDGDHKGISGLVNSMMGEGAKNLSAEKISSAFEGFGAEFNSFSNRDYADVRLRTLVTPSILDKAVNLFQNVLQKPTFPKRSFSQIKMQTIAALKIQNEDPSYVAENIFYKILYHNFPYASDSLGNIKSVRKIKRHQLISFYKRYYVGSNAKVILVGDISQTQAHLIAKIVAGGLPKGSAPNSFRSPNVNEKNAYKNVNMPISQATILIGQLGISPTNSDYFPLIVGNYIFGGLPLSSILYTEIREKRGFAYSAGSDFDTLKYNGPFILKLQTRVQNYLKALDLSKTLLVKFIEKGPTEDQLVAAKENIIGSFPISISTNSNLMNVLTSIAFYNLPLNYIDTYREKIAAIKISDIKNAFNKLFNINNLIVVTVGPKNEKIS